MNPKSDTKLSPIRNARGQLLPGVVLNPKGRPKGAYGRRMRAFLQLAELIEQACQDEAQAPAAKK